MRRRNDLLMVFAVIAAALITGRAALPFIVKDYVNGRLQALEAYDGSVNDIDIGLWRGAYRIDGIEIVKTGAQQPTPFFTSDRIDFSVEWRSLLRGSLVSEAIFIGPTLNLVEARGEQQSQLGTEEDWARRLEEYFPFRFNTVEVRDGTVTFRAPGIQAADALTARRVNGVVTNLTNVADSEKENFAEFRLSGDVLGDAPLKVNGSVEPFAEPATFDLNLALERVQIPKVNPWLREYLKADAESGDFALYLELAAADGRYKGYAKPLIRNVEFFTIAEPEENPLRRLWEGTIDLAAEIFENQPRDQIAAVIPFSGTIRSSQTDVLATIVSVLRNAFVSAFAHSLEGSISLRDVKEEVTSSEGDSE